MRGAVPPLLHTSSWRDTSSWRATSLSIRTTSPVPYVLNCLTRPDRLWGPPTPIQWVSGALSLGIKRSGHEADHSPPPSAEVEE